MATFSRSNNRQYFRAWPLWTVVYLLICISCNNHPDQTSDSTQNDSLASADTTIIQNSKTLQTNTLIFDKDSIRILPFEIDVALSSKAIDKITKSKETIIVSASLRGTPKDTTKYSKDGLFGVGNFQKEIMYGQPVKFDDIAISRKAFGQLADSTLFININVYTGRKSSPDNLIDCDFIDDTLKNIVNKSFTLKGKLIGEGTK